MKIRDIKGREILDSRGNPTIEVDVILENGIIGRASVPSGASKGTKEAYELRDGGSRYLGKGVLKAINNINTIIKEKIVGLECEDQKLLDDTLIKIDGTKNKEKLGANAILGVSMANFKACANYKNISLYSCFGKGEQMPQPLINILNGGKHANNNVDFQEFMILPKRNTISEVLQVASEVYHTLQKVLQEKGYSTSVGDEGGFAPNLNNNEEALTLIMEAIMKAGYMPGSDVLLAIDVAASELYKDGKYYLSGENKEFTREELLEYYIYLINKYPIISIEDPYYEEDFIGFQLLTEKVGSKIQIVGDDLFVTNKEYLQKGIEVGACNAILIKLNQIGTITETLETIELAHAYNYKTILSHRSGETEDTLIAHLAVGLNLGEIKIGSICRGERVCKYNELLRIEEELEKK